MLVDSHCHLDFPDFQPDLDQVIGRATDAGVGLMLTIGTHLSRFPAVLAVAERYPQVYCTVGVHPHEAASETGVTVETLLELAKHPKVVGFGETGLDYFYAHSPRAQQQSIFRLHIQAARQAGLPLVIHTRDADTDMAAILEEEYAKGHFTGLVHCFSSGRELADKALELGLFLSFSGMLSFKKADSLRLMARDLPLDRLLVETDAPYLAPVPHRGKRNEPSFVSATASTLAGAKGLGIAQIEAATTGNFLRLFNKVPG